MSKTGSKASRGRISERQRKRALTRRLRGIVIAIVGIVILGGLVAALVTNSPEDRPGEIIPDLGNQHISQPETFDDYNSVPPTSGPHWGQLAPWGASSQPIPNELQVHNLEDGGVGVQYNCPDGCPELVSQLETIVTQYSDRVFVAPYPGMETTIALTAWNRLDIFDEFDEKRIDDFIRAYRGADHHR